MRRALSAALIVSMTTPSLSMAAQAGPGRGAAERAWSKIRTLEPGAEVTVRTAGKEPRTRYFVVANDETATLLDTSDPSLPTDVAKILRQAIATHPDYFATPQRPGAVLVLDGGVSVTSSALFVGNREIAGLQLFERLTRADVERGSVQVEAGPVMDSDVAWWKVRRLAPGSLVSLATGEHPARLHVLLTADDAKLKAIDISGLSADTVKVLRQAAAEHSAQFVLTPGAALVLDKQVVLRSSGLFIADRQVAEYDQLIREVTRADVENGAVLLGHAPVMRRMERTTKIVLAVGISVALIFVISLCCVPRT